MDQRLQGECSVNQKASNETLVACPHKREGRIIVICADGTSNEFGVKGTNVIEFFSRIVKSRRQIIFYISGIGTHTTSKIGRLFDMAFANSFEKNLLIAYKWLAETYEPGDRIFLFGFSRGAYQVRVIAGMIEGVGLIYPGYIAQLPAVFKLYMSTTEKSREETMKQTKAKDLCKMFKRSISQPGVNVHFVGVWDTVSSIGVRRGASLPGTVTGMSHVCHFRHALALDERRVRFWPEHANSQPSDNAGLRHCGDVKEVWFAGSHSDIGGGNVENRALKTFAPFAPALRWMTYEAMKHGLQMRPYIGRWETPEVTKSLKGAWNILEVLPLRRPSDEGHRLTRIPHLGAARHIQKGQYIHESVLKFMGIHEATESPSGKLPVLPCYVPFAVLPNKVSWRDHQLLSGLVEWDVFPSLDSIISGIDHATKERDIERLKHEVGVLAMSISPDINKYPAPQELPKFLSAINFLRTQDNVPKIVITTLLSVLCELAPHPEHKLPFSTFRDIARKARKARKHYPEVIRRHCNLREASYDLHNGAQIKSVIMPDTDMILSASPEQVVIQNQHEAPIQSIHFDYQASVSFQADGSKFATSDLRGDVDIWDTKTGEVERTLRSYSQLLDYSWSLAFSPDGKKIAAGSLRGNIRLWSTQTGQCLFFKMGHTSFVRQLSFSPDGSWFASGSNDATREWDEVGRSEVFEWGQMVGSVAVSRDHILSASNDSKIRVWNANSGDLVRELEGHTYPVSCMAFSTDFKFIISVSADGTARLWGDSSNMALVIYNVGEDIESIAFSFDGKKIVTGSDKGKIDIWNADVLL
ncbi:hypothetical protein PTI98_004174 [Pleurotus ostreatus]|nr:hypothetical protein PTI98_004174 [Pleurotus ostreatus]